jgi:hypothetical protein
MIDTPLQPAHHPSVHAQPTDWNVVVIGAWNAAILTPAGITRRLFKVDPKTPMKVEIAMNQPGSFRVIYDELIVDPTGGRLLVSPVQCTRPDLARAANLVDTALCDLPETPVVATGVNIVYTIDSVSEPLRAVLSEGFDRQLSDAGYSISQYSSTKTVTYQEGSINIELIRTSEGTGKLSFNFERTSESNPDLRAWISKTEPMMNEVLKICSILDVAIDT